MKYIIIITSCCSLLFFSAKPISSFAAKKKGGKMTSKKKKPSTAASNLGFGVSPPTFEETLASFKTRYPDNVDNQVCPCGSGQVYSKCCAPYYTGQELPPTALAVLRSRYTAFCWRNIKYIIESTHPTCRDYDKDQITWAKRINRNGMFDSYDFVGLNVIDEQDHGEDEAFIDFQVKLRSKESGEETTVEEKSRFLKENGRWTYASGDVRSTVKGVHDIILNQ